MDILTIGEVLIDLTQTGKDARGIPQFAANPGGAPANLAVAASRLGAQTAFIGKVGADAFGRYLKEVLAENKVDVSGMAVDADHPTTMAVVSVDATGERDFSFYRSANADVMLCKEDISDEALKAAKIVHFGSVSLTADPSRTATLDAAARAKKLGATITYDPNYRANLWKNKEDAIAQMKAPLPLVDILKVSDEELPLLTGTTDCESGTAQLAQNGTVGLYPKEGAAARELSELYHNVAMDGEILTGAQRELKHGGSPSCGQRRASMRRVQKHRHNIVDACLQASAARMRPLVSHSAVRRMWMEGRRLPTGVPSTLSSRNHGRSPVSRPAYCQGGAQDAWKGSGAPVLPL